MDYQTFLPHPDMQSIVKCYWTLVVPEQPDPQRQLILPDGCVDVCFILGADIKRYISETEFILQPREMLLGQISEPFYIEPTGLVDTFAVRFYPYGFAHFIDQPLHLLGNKETPLSDLFGADTADELRASILHAPDTEARIAIMEGFLLERLVAQPTVDQIVKSTIDAMFQQRGSQPLGSLLKEEVQKRRQLERKFRTQIGISPKQLSKVIRLQATLQMLLESSDKSLTEIAYENEYYDQAHFIKDFKEFTGVTPTAFLSDEQMALSALLYKKD